MASDRASANIAANTKQLRELRGMTQSQAAALSGIPRPTWATLESGDANPTISVLMKIASALQVSVEELISPPRASCKFYPVADLETKRRGDVLIRSVLPDALRSLDLDRMQLAPGARMGGVPHRTGTREYLTCESGEIELTVAGSRFTLKEGDVVVFRGDQKHSYANTSRQIAIAYSVVLLAPTEP